MSDTIRLIAEFFAACVGTIAFALLFQVPRKYYLYCGLAGACGWICYKLFLPHTTEPVSIFFATVLVILLSRSFAVYKRCPVTVFLIAGIFPLVPGSGIYRHFNCDVFTALTGTVAACAILTALCTERFFNPPV